MDRVTLFGFYTATNPEQLFAAGYAACFHGSLALIANKAKLDGSEATVTCAVTIGRDPDDGGYMLAAKLTIKMPGIEREIAEKLVTQAHQLCPYSKAIASKIREQYEALNRVGLNSTESFEYSRKQSL